MHSALDVCDVVCGFARKMCVRGGNFLIKPDIEKKSATRFISPHHSYPPANPSGPT